MHIGSLPQTTLPPFDPLSQTPEPETGEIPVLLGVRENEETAQDSLDSTNADHHLPLLVSGIIAPNETTATTPALSLPGAPQGADAGASFSSDQLDAALTASVLSAQHSQARQFATAPAGETSAGDTKAATSAAETGDPDTEELTEEEQQKV